MSVSRMHIMASNQRLIRQIERDIYKDSDTAWVKVYSSFCKRQAQLNNNSIMQFKYKGELYHLSGDVPMRNGVKPLHKELEAEFAEVYKMFVTEVNAEKALLKNILAHAIRIAKYAEDLIELLPPMMHKSITESGFFQMDSKPPMSIDQAKQFKELYAPMFSIFEIRPALGVMM